MPIVLGGTVGITPCFLIGITRPRFNGYVLSIRHFVLTVAPLS